MSVKISYQETHLDLPHMPCEEYDDQLHPSRSTTTSTSSTRSRASTITSSTITLSSNTSASTAASTIDPSLPTFEEAVNEQLALTIDFTPNVTVQFTKSTRVKKMSTTLIRHVIESGLPQTDEVVAQWDLLSGQAEPTEGLISELETPVTIEPSTQQYALKCTLPARLPETASHKTSRLWYTLDTQVSRNKSFFSTAGPVDYSEDIMMARNTQTDAQTILPVSASVPWLNKLKYSVSYPQRHIALQEGVEIPIKLNVTLFEKPIRLNSIKFAVNQTCNANAKDKQQTEILNDYSSRHMTPDLAELDEMELNNAREQGFEIETTFLDSTHKGNLLIPGSEETVLEYTLKLDTKTIQKLSASTSYTHPLHVVHKLFTSLRFSYLAPTDKPNQKKRRYFDVSISTPLVLSRAKDDLFAAQLSAASSRASLGYDDFLLCEYPRLKNTVFENDFANDSAPSYDSFMAQAAAAAAAAPARTSLDDEAPEWSSPNDDSDSDSDSDFESDSAPVAPIAIPQRITQGKQQPFTASLPSYSFAQNY
ncbi:hypothetical protein CJU90_0096 [Yarrowia sp. C11]|nr:hypothetical protein CKK34_1507 [Yarrowia sp. E02]KAG5372456.1 hypothetical protein CJU90_0096 [Yarrowia sp. C11]